MTALNFILISLIYFGGSSTALSFGIGYYTLYRPVIAGMLTGLVMGDMAAGMMAGAVVNVIYIDFVSTGGSLRGDPCLTGVVAALAAVILKLSPVEAAAFAYPFGFAGILIWRYRLSINCIFVKAFKEKTDKGLKPDIAIYNGLLPQLLLYVMSTAVLATTMFVLFVLNVWVLNYYDIIKGTMSLAGVVLIGIAISNNLIKTKNIYCAMMFLIVCSIELLLNIKSGYIFVLAVVSLATISYSDIPSLRHNKFQTDENCRLLTKKDLVKSWAIWMNFSHSCYNYERMQGMAFAHSMKCIVNKLYKDENTREQLIYSYTEFFNTEPNIGTAIHGCIIDIEEKNVLGKHSINAHSVKNGMMGAVAGLGDSITQMVITPLFMSMVLILCFDNNRNLALIPIIMLGITIIYISYRGWMSGYYYGRQSILDRITKIKKNKIKTYFPVIFGALFGASIGKLAEMIYRDSLFNIGYIVVAVVVGIAYSVMVENGIKEKYLFLLIYAIPFVLTLVM